MIIKGWLPRKKSWRNKKSLGKTRHLHDLHARLSVTHVFGSVHGGAVARHLRGIDESFLIGWRWRKWGEDLDGFWRVTRLDTVKIFWEVFHPFPKNGKNCKSSHLQCTLRITWGPPNKRGERWWETLFFAGFFWISKPPVTWDPMILRVFNMYIYIYIYSNHNHTWWPNQIWASWRNHVFCFSRKKSCECNINTSKIVCFSHSQELFYMLHSYHFFSTASKNSKVTSLSILSNLMAELVAEKPTKTSLREFWPPQKLTLLAPENGWHRETKFIEIPFWRMQKLDYFYLGHSGCEFC